MTRHDPERHEEELIELLAADAEAAEAAFEASPLAECDVCRDLVREHVELARRLDGLGGKERGALAEAAALELEEGAAERALRELIERETRERGATTPDAPPPRARGAARRPWMGWAAAAAAVVLAVLAIRELGPQGDGLGPILGPGVETLEPSGEVEDFSRFTWTHKRPAGGWFELSVYREVPDGIPELVYESGRLEDNTWAPPREVHEAWPDRIVWRVDVYSGTAGDVVDSSRSSARRSSR